MLLQLKMPLRIRTRTNETQRRIQSRTRDFYKRDASEDAIAYPDSYKREAMEEDNAIAYPDSYKRDASEDAIAYPDSY